MPEHPELFPQSLNTAKPLQQAILLMNQLLNSPLRPQSERMLRRILKERAIARQTRALLQNNGLG
ncbi:MAG TPA: hypothetical protein V6C99_07185 [Oculatellaceae cyanobacterium]|jgi:hypothetical protein